MKLRIYGEKEKPEKEVFLRLVEKYGRVSLLAVDENGERVLGGDLLTISEGGFSRTCSVSKEIGLPLDEDGQVIIDE